MSLETPDKIRSLQRKLYRKAKAEPNFRFYLLYDKICREDILRHAYAVARANAGAPGVDGMTFERIDASGVEVWLEGLREELVSKRYHPEPVRRVKIPKPGGGERRSGFRRFGIGWFKPLPSSCWNRYSKRTWKTVLMAIGRVTARSMPSRKRTGYSAGAIPTSLTPICRNTSTRSRTRTSLNRWPGASPIGTCCG